jgi:hypothetical protein
MINNIKPMLVILILLNIMAVNADDNMKYSFEVTPFDAQILETIPWGEGRPLNSSAVSSNLRACLSDIHFVYRVAPYTEIYSVGTITVNNDLIADLRIIFKKLYNEPAFSMSLVEPIYQFDWNDQKSMWSNNTSGFNFRYISRTKKLSNHSVGRAIDINPRVNPWVGKGGRLDPSNGSIDPQEPGSFLPGSPSHYLVQSFRNKGWSWGGDWKNIKDYQHFEKKISYPGSKYCENPN